MGISGKPVHCVNSLCGHVEYMLNTRGFTKKTTVYSRYYPRVRVEPTWVYTGPVYIPVYMLNTHGFIKEHAHSNV